MRICIGEVCVRSRWLAARAFDVEGVHVVARGMVLGNIQRFEIVVRRFDFRAFDHAEADREKNALQLFVCLADQVARADRALDAGKREIDLSRPAPLVPRPLRFRLALRRVPLRRAL